MRVLQCILAASLVGEIRAAAGYFDVEEFRDIAYDADISNDMLWFAPDVDVSKLSRENIDNIEKQILDKMPSRTEEKYMFVTSKTGQKFACELPEVKRKPKSDDSGTSVNPKVYAELINAGFYVNKCITMRTNGWWKYELCRGRTVEQTHGRAGDEDYVRNILGVFSGRYSMPEYTTSTADQLLYVEEVYEGGTVCELDETDKSSRKTFVRYTCDATLGTQDALFSSIDEPSPCEYIVHVKVGSLCSKQQFLPPNQRKANLIDCFPYIGSKDLRRYLNSQLKKVDQKKKLNSDLLNSMEALKRVRRRRIALTKTMMKNKERDARIVADVEREYRNVIFNHFVIKMKTKKGKEPTSEELDAIWTLISMTDMPETQYYTDYETIFDEDEGNLWYYFNDKTWPRHQFPTDMLYAAVYNEYHKQVVDMLSSSILNAKIPRRDTSTLLEKVKILRKYHPSHFEQNLLITSHDIIERMIINIRRSSYNPLYDILDDWLSPDSTERYVHHKIMDFIENGDGGDERTWPLGDYSKLLIPHLFEFVRKDIVAVMNGDAETMSPFLFTAISDYIEMEAVDKKDDPEYPYKYKIHINNMKEARLSLEVSFMQVFAPVYEVFRLKYNRRHTNDPFDFPLTVIDGKSAEYSQQFYNLLVLDGVKLCQLLASATLFKIRVDTNPVNIKEKKNPASPKLFEANWPDIGKKQKLYDLARLFSHFEAFQKELEYRHGYYALRDAWRDIWREMEADMHDTIIDQYEKKKKEAMAMQKVLTEYVDEKGDMAAEMSFHTMTIGDAAMDTDERLSRLMKAILLEAGYGDTSQESVNDAVDIAKVIMGGSLTNVGWEETLDIMEGLEAGTKQADMKKLFDIIEKSGIGIDGVEMKMNVVDENGENMLESTNVDVREAARQMLDEAMWRQEEQKRTTMREAAYATTWEEMKEVEPEDIKIQFDESRLTPLTEEAETTAKTSEESEEK